MIPSGTRSASGEPLTPAELAAWAGALRTVIRLRAELGAALTAHHGLSMADYDFLVRLTDAESHRMRMADLARRILQPRSSLTRIATGLEQRGLVRREPSADDGRGTEVVLTPAGLALLRAAQRDHLDHVRERFLSHLDDAQLAALADAWEAIGRAAEEGP